MITMIIIACTTSIFTAPSCGQSSYEFETEKDCKTASQLISLYSSGPIRLVCQDKNGDWISTWERGPLPNF